MDSTKVHWYKFSSTNLTFAFLQKGIEIYVIEANIKIETPKFNKMG